MTRESITVAIIEDHPVYRHGLAGYIEDAPDLQLGCAAASVAELDQHQQSDSNHQAHIVLLDLQLQDGIHGPAAITHLRDQGHIVLVVSASAKPATVINAMAAGAAGYISKNAEPEEILDAIRKVAAGQTHYSASLAGYLLDSPHRAHLSPRQIDVLRLVARGDTNQEIADQLHITIATVNNHLEKIRDKTGHRGRVHLTKFAIDEGLLDDPNGCRQP